MRRSDGLHDQRTDIFEEAVKAMDASESKSTRQVRATLAFMKVMAENEGDVRILMYEA